MTIETIVEWLEAIAKKNDDEFKYKITIEPTRRGLEYSFECRESADDHLFVSGDGPSIEDAVGNSAFQLGESCEEWGYDFVPQPTTKQ